MADIVALGLSLDASKVLTARDKANRALDSISRSSKKTQASVSALQKGFGRLLGAAGALVGIAALTRGFRAMVSAVKAGEQSAAKLDAVLKATGFSAGRTAEQINRLGKEMARTTLFDDDAIRDTSAVLATFRKVQGDVFNDAIGLIADMATVLGTDLKSAALQVGKVLQDPVARIGEMSRAGITFTKAQKDMVRAMVEVGDTAGAQGIILNELRMEFGGAAAAANVGLSGAIRQTTKSWDDFLESLGRTGPTQAKLGGFFGLMESFFRKRILTTDPLEDLIIKQEEINALIDERRRGGVNVQEVEEIKRLLEELNKVKQQMNIIGDMRGRDQRLAEEAAAAAVEAAERERAVALERAARLKAAQTQAEEFNAKQKALAQAWQRSWGRAIENTQDSFADFFENLLTGGVDSFKEFARQVLDVWIKLTAQIAATQLFQFALGTSLGQSLAAPGIPKLKTADDFLQASASPGGDFASQGGVTVNQTIQFNVAAMDAASFQQFAEQNKGVIAGVVGQAAQESVALRRAFRGR